MQDLNQNNLTIPSVDCDPHILITPTRKYYFDYICKLLSQNYISWCGELPPHAVVGATRELELQAAAKAMVVPLYRKAILSTIETIKQHTQNNDLFPSLHNFCILNKSCDKSSQTDDLETNEISNENNISYINATNDINKIGNIEPMTYDVSKETRNESIEFEDKVLKDMELLFQTSDTENIEDDIFGEYTNDRQIMLIMEEINQYGKNCKKNDSLDNKNTMDVTLQNNVNNPNNETSQFKSDLEVKKLPDISSNEAALPQKYTYSKWPCELYYKKKFLREKLDHICEKSYILHSKLKEQFIDLFGAQSEDEQGLQSPDTSVNFLRSCRQRIAPYVSRHIKPYYLRGSIPAHLLRPLAKYLMYQVIQINQYPGDYEVYLYIKQYFKIHRRIRCQADF